MTRQTKRNRTQSAPLMLRVPAADVRDVMQVLDASEQLLELLKGPLNGGDETFVQDLLSLFQDRAIVSVRMRLHAAYRAGGFTDASATKGGTS